MKPPVGPMSPPEARPLTRRSPHLRTRNPSGSDPTDLRRCVLSGQAEELVQSVQEVFSVAPGAENAAENAAETIYMVRRDSRSAGRLAPNLDIRSPSETCMTVFE